MITTDTLRGLLGALVRRTLEDGGRAATWIRDDAARPLIRPSYRIDVTAADDYGTRDYAERAADVEIYYYPGNTERPRDELADVADRLRAALRAGFDAGTCWIYTSDTIDSDTDDGVLSLLFSVEWVETIGDEDAEPMENLIINGEEVVSDGD